MKKTITLLTLMFISLNGYADDFTQYKILPQQIEGTIDNVYIQNVNIDNQYLALGVEIGQGEYNIDFNSVGTEVKLVASGKNDGTFYLYMYPPAKKHELGRDQPKLLQLYVRNDSYQLVAYDRDTTPFFLKLFSADTLNEGNSRVAWYTDANGLIARSYDNGEAVVFDKEQVDSKDSRRWNFFVREEPSSLR